MLSPVLFPAPAPADLAIPSPQPPGTCVSPLLSPQPSALFPCRTALLCPVTSGCLGLSGLSAPTPHSGVYLGPPSQAGSQATGAGCISPAVLGCLATASLKLLFHVFYPLLVVSGERATLVPVTPP